MRLVQPMIGGFERIGPAPAWGPATLQVLYPYAGIVPLLLIAVAIWRSRNPVTTLLGLMAIVAFALAVESPLLELFMLLVPPYRQFQDHARWFVLWGFATALLAGIGA
jgi:hypothetical protein